MKGVLTIPNKLYAGHDENFKFILNIFLKNNNFDLSLTNRYESLKSNLNNYDYSVVIIEDGNWSFIDNSHVEVPTEKLITPAFCLKDGEMFDANSPLLPQPDLIAA